VAGTDLGIARRPGWWSLAGSVQWLLLAAAVAGLVWIGVDAAWQALFVVRLPVAHVGRVPVPTLLLLGGVALGLLLALVARWLAAAGARRRAARARRRLRRQVAAAADGAVVAPVGDVLTRYARFCAAVHRAE
jgi:hypothetical protein